jgi:hypothetical protein
MAPTGPFTILPTIFLLSLGLLERSLGLLEITRLGLGERECGLFLA